LDEERAEADRRALLSEMINVPLHLV
jgi:hypothetical protein